MRKILGLCMLLSACGSKGSDKREAAPATSPAPISTPVDAFVLDAPLPDASPLSELRLPPKGINAPAVLWRFRLEVERVLGRGTEGPMGRGSTTSTAAWSS